MSKIIIYKAGKIVEPEKTSLDFRMEWWKPSLSSLIPPGKSVKYIIYSLFYFAGIFKSRHYGLVRAFQEKEPLASMLVVPANYKWPFMGKDDVQFTYVMTSKKHRGLGLAWQMIYKASKELKQVTDFWYVTDTSNPSSMRLAEKMGFKVFSENVEKKAPLGVLKVVRHV